jgi:hypothetical protein
MKIKLSYFIFVILLALGCKKEQTIETVAQSIDEDLVPYFERFKEEGEARGITVDFLEANISGVLDNITTENVSAQCVRNSIDPDQVVIDIVAWRRASDLKREFLVFHELGHCFLDRRHLDTSRPDGTCTSIMHSGLSNCRDAYSSTTRADYLDELFLEQ